MKSNKQEVPRHSPGAFLWSKVELGTQRWRMRMCADHLGGACLCPSRPELEVRVPLIRSSDYVWTRSRFTSSWAHLLKAPAASIKATEAPAAGWELNPVRHSGEKNFINITPTFINSLGAVAMHYFCSYSLFWQKPAIGHFRERVFLLSVVIVFCA